MHLYLIDLDDTSHTDENHPENGGVGDHLSGPELSESESEVSVKGEETLEPEDIEPLETPYIENEEEEFGSVSLCVFFIYIENVIQTLLALSCFINRSGMYF